MSKYKTILAQKLDEGWTSGCGDRDLWDRYSHVKFPTSTDWERISSIYRDSGDTYTINTRRASYPYTNIKDIGKTVHLLERGTPLNGEAQ